MRYLTLLSVLVFLMSSCGNEQEKTSTQPSGETEPTDTIVKEQPKYPSDPKFDAFANFISGTEGAADGELKALEELPAWQVDSVHERREDVVTTAEDHPWQTMTDRPS